MELFKATGNLKTFFFFICCSMCAPQVTRHIYIRYSTSCHTRVNMRASIFFTAAIIRGFRLSRSRGTATLRTLHVMHVAD